MSESLKLPRGLTLQRICDAIEQGRATLGNPGFCLACGAEVEGVEPDAREYECELCGESQVYGAEELAIEFL